MLSTTNENFGAEISALAAAVATCGIFSIFRALSKTFGRKPQQSNAWLSF